MAESRLTKKALGKSLKDLTNKKRFDKISVGDITDNCGVNRQTFYYHFSDKNQLLKYIYKTEFIEPYMTNVNFSNWDARIVDVLKKMQIESQFCINTISHANNYLLSFFLDEAEALFEDAIKDLDERNIVNSEDRRFFARFFAYGVCGVLTEWVLNGMNDTPDNIAEKLRQLLDSSERAAYHKITGDILPEDISH